MAYWQNRSHLDPAILGRRIIVDDVPVTLVGVAARGFQGVRVAAPLDIWSPGLQLATGLGGLDAVTGEDGPDSGT